MESKPPSAPPDVPDGDRREFLTKRLLPAATVVGALGVVGAAVLRPGAAPPAPRPSPPPEPAPALPTPAPTGPLPHTYSRTALLAGPGLPAEFRRSLSGLALGPGDEVHALGDDEARVLDAGGHVVRAWAVPKGATCLGVAADGRVAVGSAGRVDLFDADGTRIGGFACGASDKPAVVTAVRFVGDSVLVADAAARVIRRYDTSGHEAGTHRIPEQDRRVHAAEQEPRFRRRCRGCGPRGRQRPSPRLVVVARRRDGGVLREVRDGQARGLRRLLQPGERGRRARTAASSRPRRRSRA